MKHLIRLLFLTLAIGMASQEADAATRETTPQEELIYRVTLGTPKDVKVLLKKVKNPNMVDNMGWPLLAIASSRTDDVALGVVKLLVAEGADVNFHGGLKNYPLIMAIQSGNAHIVEYLLEQGADIRATDAYGVTVADFARNSEKEEIRTMIEDAVQDEVENITRKRSQDYLDKITYDLAYHSCAFQYYSYYYKSGQDAIPLATQQATINKHKKVIARSITDLAVLFRAPDVLVKDIYREAKQAMFNEMELLISNRWRRIKGVGRDGDMEERCARLCEKWEEGVFDKNALDSQI